MLLQNSQSSVTKGGVGSPSSATASKPPQQQQGYSTSLQASNASNISTGAPYSQYLQQGSVQPSLHGSTASFIASNGTAFPHSSQAATTVHSAPAQFVPVPEPAFSGASFQPSSAQQTRMSAAGSQPQAQQQQQALLTSQFESQVQNQQTNALQSIRALAASASAPSLSPPSPEGLHPFVFQYKSTKYELDHCLALLQALNLEIAAVKKNTSVLQKMVHEHSTILKKYGAGPALPPQTFAPPVVPPSASERQRAGPPSSADARADTTPLEHITNGSPQDPVDGYLNAFIQTRPDLNLRIVKKDPPLYLLNNQEAFIAMRDGIVSIRDGLGWTPFNDFIAEATGAAQQQLQQAASAKKKKVPLKKKKAPLKKKKATTTTKKKLPAKAKRPVAAGTKPKTSGGPSASAIVAKKRTANLSIKRITAQRSAAKNK